MLNVAAASTTPDTLDALATNAVHDARTSRRHLDPFEAALGKVAELPKVATRRGRESPSHTVCSPMVS